MYCSHFGKIREVCCNKLLVSFKLGTAISTSTWRGGSATCSMDRVPLSAPLHPGAATSASLSSGVSLQVVLSTAKWASPATFKKFYYRNIEELSFMDGVLSRTVSV